ncbi:hypothetical protein PSACC_03640 [Paramicrosporidium saccamoebae]|uniref:BSD domain-containing protein n=1 Tax=Paramicrosporidium saccamoebae TaxID=1246581 RepID=A0A2H9TFU0_9FUNG|nr:hypothetical protein PSACC_03640 [Paramicrosporidium saccamoebae]
MALYVCTLGVAAPNRPERTVRSVGSSRNVKTSVSGTIDRLLDHLTECEIILLGPCVHQSKLDINSMDTAEPENARIAGNIDNVSEVTGGDHGEESDDIWKTFTATATSFYNQVARSCQEELSHFVAEVAEEVSEVYHDNLEEPVQNFASRLPKMFADEGPEEIRLNESPQEKDENWTEFQSSRGFNATFGDQQQRIILANDIELKKLYSELVPSVITEEQFWIRWRLWQHIRNQQIVAPRPAVDGEVAIAVKDSPTLDAVNVSFINNNSPNNGKTPKEADDWDSWD